jgi:O-antigen ligase
MGVARTNVDILKGLYAVPDTFETASKSLFGPAVLSVITASWRARLDLFAILTAILLPWSTTAVSILMLIWFVAAIFAVNFRAFLLFLRRPACIFPLLFLALAIVGMAWANGPWILRLDGIKPVIKLLAIPFLLFHFARSQHVNRFFIAFLVSCTLLQALSWLVFFVPEWKVAHTLDPGVPVKNYIDQSQEFTLCMFALAPYVITLLRQRRFLQATFFATLMFTFFANMMFVVSARTALIYIPVLLIVFAMQYLARRAAILLFVVAVGVATVVWFSSPYLRNRIYDAATGYDEYRQNIVSPTSRRLEYWHKSLGFFVDAPLFGHGTGSTKLLFEQAAAGESGLSAEVTGNPHNQTLSVAVQWGLLGVFILYSMWICHLMLFRRMDLSAWIGLIVVVQNIVSSLLNSHLFDFVEGWIYVLGVGIAGGMSFSSRHSASDASARP